MKTRIFALLLAALLCASLLASPVLADSEEPAPESPSAEATEDPAEAADSSAEPAESEESSESEEDSVSETEAPASDEPDEPSGEVTAEPLLTEQAQLDGDGEEPAVLAEGDTEHRVHWTLYADGLLYLKANDRYGSLEKDEHPWLDYKDKITSLVIEAGDALNYIPERMFYNMDSLNTVTVNGSLRDIDASAFLGCDSLTEVTIHGNVGEYEGGFVFWGGIGDSAFQDCKKLAHFNVYGVISKIGASAFSGCSLSNLDAPVLGDIGTMAFHENEHLTNISPIRGSVGDHAFFNANLDRGNGIYIVSGHSETFGTDAFLRTVIMEGRGRGNPYNKYYHPSLYFTGTQAEFEASYTNNSGASVTAYQKLGGNVTWTLSDGVLTIDGSGSTIDLLDVTEQPWLNVPGKTWDENREQITSVRVRYGIELGEHMLDGLEDRVEYFYDHSGTVGDIAWNITDGVLTVSGTGATPDLYQKNDEAWMPYRDQIRQIVIEEGVTAVGYASFMQCPKLERVTFPSTVTQIGTGAFYECPKLDQVTLPENLTKLSDSVFSGCSGLKTVYIPESVTAIGSQAFQRTALTDVYYGGTTESWAKLGKGEVNGATVSIDGVYNVRFHPSAPGLTPAALDPPGYPAPTEKPDPTEKPEPTAEPEPTDRPAPTATPKPSARPSGGGDDPKTGDDTPVTIWALALLICAAGLTALPLARKKTDR